MDQASGKDSGKARRPPVCPACPRLISPQPVQEVVKLSDEAYRIYQEPYSPPPPKYTSHESV
ncbi:hypothetical protein E2C01_027265 [Portunus trituberculatus]|uniref:Uncharacterized protein n=1 Tax=Portunus trituberculatus TaxID=210409 RepID=A0A5B7EKV7_PORTR|nr:hypothetical protein [Portunus trituberculatus]